MNMQEMFHERIYTHPSDYNFKNNGGSDISLALPELHYYAGKCKHITEFGVRNGHSTVALMYGMGQAGKMISYDIHSTPFVDEFKEVCAKEGYHWIFRLENTGNENLIFEETDLLFIDTLHTCNHVMREIRHAPKVKQFIIFHDTHTCWHLDSSGEGLEGIGRPIEQLLASNEWDIVYQTYVNNGLMVLERVNNPKPTKPLYIWKNNRFEKAGETRREEN